jgi:hypothetical protein
MANVRIGSHPSHKLQVSEFITSAKQLTWKDSGKMFFVAQNTADYVINLPKLTAEIAGWNATFLLTNASSGGDDIQINGYGVPLDGGSGDDENKFYIIESAGNTTEQTQKDGVKFEEDQAQSPNMIQVCTDGELWYVNAAGSDAADIKPVPE